eukprot:2740346-Alexandrium_andersonii.AAC.1
MRAQARAAAEQVARANLVEPAAAPSLAHTPEFVQAVRRNAPIHCRDPEVPGHTLRRWHYSRSATYRLVADPLSEEAGGPAPL